MDRDSEGVLGLGSVFGIAVKSRSGARGAAVHSLGLFWLCQVSVDNINDTSPRGFHYLIESN